MINNKAKSLYIHIPFCRHICYYCDFAKVLLDTGFSDKYISNLLKEDENYLGYNFDTIYLGGGTPSCLDLKSLDYLLNTLVKRHGNPIEFTIECNPEDINEEFVKVIKSNGVNRVSLGCQTTSDRLLKELGRKHTYSDVVKAVDLLRKYGIDNISLDFIYGFDGQSMDDLKNDLKEVKRLDLNHVSFYSLQVESNTMFAINHKNEPDSDMLANEYELIVNYLESIGLKRYEISNFAKPGYESKHNLCYWLSNPYAAIGMGATSFIDNVRVTRTRSIKKYLSGDIIWKEEKEDLNALEFDFLMLNLRLTKGFELNEFKKRFDKDFLLEYKKQLEELKDYFLIDDYSVKVKAEYLYILDSILVDLLKF